ncbi:hypothetical protein C0J52_17271 [Blattella germanica]|nr:hypothetical protein C0J52_17271 [Blattella germanica]
MVKRIQGGVFSVLGQKDCSATAMAIAKVKIMEAMLGSKLSKTYWQHGYVATLLICTKSAQIIVTNHRGCPIFLMTFISL